MASGEPLPDGDQITRGCSRGFDNGEVTASAFALRPADQALLRISVDWVECRYVDIGAQNLAGSIKRMRAPPVVQPPYAVLGVSDIREVRRGEFALDAIEDGRPSNPCHCAITGYSGTKSVDLELQDDLAEIANRSPIIEAPE